METARTPGFVAWPEKLITQAEAFVLAASWPISVNILNSRRPDRALPMTVDEVLLVLVCQKDECRQSCGQLRRGQTTYNGSLDEMLSMVLRHMVMAHDVSLAGLRKAHDDGT